MSLRNLSVNCQREHRARRVADPAPPQPTASPHKRCRMRVFVTGAIGFIDSCLVPELINAGPSRGRAQPFGRTRRGAHPCRGWRSSAPTLTTSTACVPPQRRRRYHPRSLQPRLLQPEAEQRGQPSGHRDARRGAGLLGPAAHCTGLASSKTGRTVVEADDHVTSSELPPQPPRRLPTPSS